MFDYKFTHALKIFIIVMTGATAVKVLNLLNISSGERLYCSLLVMFVAGIILEVWLDKRMNRK